MSAAPRDQAAPGSWKAIEALFHGALALPPEERRPFLEHHCRDPATRHAVARLLHASEHAGDFIERLLRRVVEEA